MDQYELIRTAKRVYEKSIRQIARDTGHHRVTIRKALSGQEPKYRRRKRVKCPVMDPVSGVVKQWLREDRERPKKQRHTAHRIYRRLVQEHGFAGGESTVRRWVREWKVAQGWGSQKAMVPLDPEVAREAEVDWGTAWVQMGSERRRVKLFVMRSRYSGKPFVRAYAWERQEMFFDAHMRAFHYYGGVFRELVYDNLTLSVKQILRGGRRVEQERFVAFRSYYTYRARFCNPGQGHEKGGVEGLIGFVRRNFLVPLPRVENFDQLNELLLERCCDYGSHRIAGREDNLSVEERFEAEQSRLLPLPDRPYENFKAVRVKVDRYCTVRIDGNRYSVPRAYVGRWVWAHIHCQKIALYADERPVAQHDRLFCKSRWQIDPLHYLDLIFQRVGSFESARAIVQWRARWPKDYDLLLQQLRLRQGHNRGTREFVRILGLHRDYERTQVEQAIASVLQQRCPSYESIRHLIRLQESAPLVAHPLPAELIPGVTDRAVLMSDVKNFNALLTAGGS